MREDSHTTFFKTTRKQEGGGPWQGGPQWRKWKDEIICYIRCFGRFGGENEGQHTKLHLKSKMRLCTRKITSILMWFCGLQFRWELRWICGTYQNREKGKQKEAYRGLTSLHKAVEGWRTGFKMNNIQGECKQMNVKTRSKVLKRSKWAMGSKVEGRRR